MAQSRVLLGQAKCCIARLDRLRIVLAQSRKVSTTQKMQLESVPEVHVLDQERHAVARFSATVAWD